MDEKIMDRIDRYFRKEMSPEECLEFEQEMLNDESLRQDVEFVYRLRKGLASRQQKLECVSKWRHKNRRFAVYVISVSSLAAVLICGVFIMRPKADREQVMLAKKETPLVKKEETDGNAVTKVKKAMAKGENEKAVETVDVLERNKVIPTLDEISAGRFVMNHTLENEKSDSLSDEAYELHWLRICSLVKMGMIDEAIESLKIFVHIKGQYKEQADSLLQVFSKQ